MANDHALLHAQGACTAKARLVFRVGVTGHRPDKLYANASKRVAGKVSTLLTEIQMVARRIIDDAPGSYDSREPVVRLVSLWRRKRIVWRRKWACKWRPSCSAFCRSRARSQFGACLFTVFANLVRCQLPKRGRTKIHFDPDAPKEAWRGKLGAVNGLSSTMHTFLLDGLAAHHGWADRLAKHYPNRHRSSFVANYLLGAVAVLLGVQTDQR